MHMRVFWVTGVLCCVPFLV